MFRACVLLSVMGVCMVTGTDYSYKLDMAVEDAANGSDYKIARFIVSSAASNKTICSSNVDEDTLSVLCMLSGYTEYVQLEADNSSYTWSESLSIGYQVACGETDTFAQCDITTTDTCEDLLVINCTDHYTSIIGGLTTNDLIMPVILIPCCILYVVILCYLESVDVRKTAANKQRVVAGIAKEGAKAFQNAGTTKKGGDGAV